MPAANAARARTHRIADGFICLLAVELVYLIGQRWWDARRG